MTHRQPTADSPEELFARYRAHGDPESAGRLFDATSPALFALALKLAPDAAAAEDALQETFLAAIESAHRFEDGRAVMPWLFGILRRKLGRQHRVAARRPAPLSDDVARGDDPVLAAASAEDRERVRNAIESLDEPYRGVALLRWRYGLEPAEIADVRGEPPGTVRSLLHRAARKLEPRLGAAPGVALLSAGRGLEAIRADVVSAAARLRPTPPRPPIKTAASAATLATGGVLLTTTQKVAFSLAAAALLLVGSVTVMNMDGASPSGQIATDAEDLQSAGAADAEERRRVRPAGDEPVVVERDTAPTQQMPEPVDLDAVDRDREVHGRVVDMVGEPIAGATLRTLRRPWRRTTLLNLDGNDVIENGPATLSARDGTFTMRLRRGALVELGVTCDGYEPRHIPNVQAGERLRIELRASLTDAVILRVRVVDAQDAPVEGAAVRAFRMGGTTGDSMDATEETSSDGLAVFEAVPPAAKLYVDVEAAGHGSPGWLRAVMPSSGTLEIDAKLPVGRTIRGVVTSAETGDPIEGAIVGMSWTQSRAVRTAADGSYELTGWTGSGVQDLAVSAEGYGRRSVRVENRDVLDIALPTGAAVRGRITDHRRSPIPGALVSAIASEFGNKEQQLSMGFTTAGKDGSFHIESLTPSMHHTLVVMVEGYGRTLLDFDLAADGLDLGDVRLSAARSIEGVVLDGDSEPMARVQVVLTGENDGRARLTGRKSPDVFYGRAEDRRTDDLGRFRFPDLASGDYRIYAQPAGAPRRELDIQLRGADIHDVVLQFVRTRTVTVRVEAPDGEPMSGVYVQCPSERGVNVQTDADGVATLSLPPRRTVKIAVFATGIPANYVHPEWRDVEHHEDDVTFRFGIGEHVRARVVDDVGDAVVGIEVRLERDGKQTMVATTDDEGRVKVLTSSIDPVDLRVTGLVQTTDGRTVSVDRLPLRGEAVGVVPGAPEVMIRCERVAYDRTLSAIVLDPDGRPVAGARVSIYDAAQPTTLETKAAGRVDFTDLPPDECGLLVQNSERTAGEDWLRPAIVRVVPEGQVVELPFRNSKLIEGQLLDTDDNPVVGARITARRGAIWIHNGVSELEGRFAMTIPDDGELFTVDAFWVRSDGSRAELRVETDGASEIQIREP